MNSISSEKSSVVDEDSDLPSLSNLGDYVSSSRQKAGKSRDSLSSASTSNDQMESSRYSTPGTSAMNTPMEGHKSSDVRRGRRSAKEPVAQTSIPVVNAVARAAALRNSQFSLSATSIKRKRVADSEDDDDEEDTPDAQLARSLQEQEDANATSMALYNEMPIRRTPRKMQKILPKSDFLSDSDGAQSKNSFIHTASTKLPTGNAKVEVVIKNPRSGNSRRRVHSGNGSETDDFIEVDDSHDEGEDDDSDAPIAMFTSRKIAPKTASHARDLVPGTVASTAKRSVGARQAASASTLKVMKGKKRATATNAVTEPTDGDDSDGSIFASDSDMLSELSEWSYDTENEAAEEVAAVPTRTRISGAAARRRINNLEEKVSGRAQKERARLVRNHPELNTMWDNLENLPKIGKVQMEQPKNISRELKPFQLEGVAWMKAMEQTEWGGGLLGDEMGMGKTIQAVSLIMSDWPAKQPSLVLIPPVALMQWQQEIASYTDGTLRTFVFHGTNRQTNNITVKELKKYDVILMSYNSLESMYRKQEKGFTRKNGLHKERSVIHQIHFHRVILDEAHNIKVSRIISSQRSLC